MSSPLVEGPALFHVGPVPFTESTLTSFALTAALGGVCFLLSRRLSVRPGRLQAAVEVVVTGIEDQVREVIRRDPAPYLPLLGTLFFYLVTANCIGVVPLVHPPTGHVETPLALALVVFCSVYYYGVRARGVVGYVKHFFQPSPILAPIQILSEITRTFSLTMRLAGNIMSHGLVLAVVVSIAGLFVPIPIMAFGLLVGIVQAYVFTVLATVYVGAAVEDEEEGKTK
jgi:F-type H+-transporting ATPase subunit a